ncbi:EAL domain-containing protein [Thermodesulfobacteriota bacterium]
MKIPGKDKHDFVSASIHKKFYYNENLQVPTIIKEYQVIEKTFENTNYIACITVQIPYLFKIEYRYGSMIYSNLLNEVATILKDLRKNEFRSDDILLLDIFDIDTFIIFLSAPRDSETQILDHLEMIAERVRISIEQKLFHLFYPYIKDYYTLAIGYSLVIKNPMINNMRLIMQLVNSSKDMGEFMALKQSHSSKYLLQKIILEKNINTVFQPIVNLNTLDVIGYEALSRGPADTEFASPLLLFVMATEFGLAFELDSLCRQRAFENSNKVDRDKKIFVNTLAMTIHDPEYRGAYLEQLFKDLKIKPQNVIFEINEKLAIDNYDLFRTAMQDYQDIGIVQATDDIGSGLADLERIMELNPGYMKIDITLVRDIHKSTIKQQMLRAMASMAQDLGALVIAEGVETKEEYQILKEMDIQYGQGYLFGRPSETIEPVNKDFLIPEKDSQPE